MEAETCGAMRDGTVRKGSRKTGEESEQMCSLSVSLTIAREGSVAKHGLCLSPPES